MMSLPFLPLLSFSLFFHSILGFNLIIINHLKLIVMNNILDD
jgi:hypothetical protein